MTKKEQAQISFKEGFSCSQAVLASFAGDSGLPRDLALKLSQPFGAGIAKMADWCGAVTGAFLVIGLKFGRVLASDTEARDRTYILVREFTERFKKRNGGKTSCRDLLGCDIGTPEGLQQAETMKLHERLCEGFVRDACEILEDLI